MIGMTNIGAPKEVMIPQVGKGKGVYENDLCLATYVSKPPYH
jgi:hypothetical protein